MAKFLDSTGLSKVISLIKGALGLKQDTLVSGTNIKTVNRTSLLGGGNITIKGVSDASNNTPSDGTWTLTLDNGDTYIIDLNHVHSQYQETLVSGTSIKTINNTSLLGSGNIDIDISGKVDKVSSTDNAVVRFDGTSGDVQNSSVTIDDSANITTSGNVATSSLNVPTTSDVLSTTTGINFGNASSPTAHIAASTALGIFSSGRIYIRPNGATSNATGNGSVVIGNDGVTVSEKITAEGFKTTSGTSSQFLKADGSLDSNTYALNSALSDKTDKVATSTDNAVVRFDGTSGNIQNSGVIINDSDQITASNFIAKNGTSKQFLRASGTYSELLPTEQLVEPNYTNSSSVTSTTYPLVNTLRGNVLALLKASQIIIEQTVDGGETWTDAGFTDSEKVALFRGTDAIATIYMPRINDVRNKLCGIRITITAMNYNVPDGTAETDKYAYWNNTYVASTNRYCTLDRIYVWCNSVTDNIKVRAYCAKGNDPNTWIDADRGSASYMAGQSGGNVIMLANRSFGGSTTQTTNYWNYRFEFFTDGVSGGDLSTYNTTSRQSILNIQGFGRSHWSCPNNIMAIDHLYTWDNSQNATFPANITATNDLGCKSIYIKGSVGTNNTRYITSDNSANIYFSINNKIPLLIKDTEVRSGQNLTGTINLGTSSAYWNNVYGKKFIVQGGTASKFLKGDGSLDSNSYAKNGDYQMPTNSMGGSVAGFGAYSVQQNLINNGLFAADKRYTVTLTGFSDNTKAERLFDGSYESYIQVPPNGTGTILIEHTSELFGSYYCYGNTYMTFYYSRAPESVTMRVYGKASSNASRDWYDISSTKVVDTAYYCIVKFTNTSIGSCTKFEFTITAKESNNAWPVQIDQQFNRGTAQMMSAVTKYPVTQSLYGDVYAPKFITRGATSTQFVKGDGSLDDNTYLTASSSTITDILSRLSALEAAAGIS